MQRYIDMEPGLINLMGIRNVQLGENLWGGNRSQFSISIQYKGIGNIIFYYKTQEERDRIYAKMRDEILKIK